MSPQRWGVVGGGMLGMTLALWLRDQGHEVTILEGAPGLGGLAAPWELGDVVWDRHYHVILNSDQHLLKMLERLDLEDDLVWGTTRTGVYAEDELYSVSNAIEYLRFPPLSIIDKLRMAWTILYGSRLKDWRRLEDIPVEQWLRKHSGDRAFEKFWRPLLRSKLGDNYRRTSAAFIWTTIQRLYAARRTGLKTELFGYVSGGYQTIISRFEEVLTQVGVSVEVGQKVTSVVSIGDEIRVDTEADSRIFDRVVVTLAAPLAAQVVQGLDSSESERLQNVEYQGIVCASMLTEQKLGGFYVTNITEEGVPFTGVIEMSALVDRSAFGGYSLVYLPRYTTEDDSITAISDAEVESIFVAGVQRMFPDFDPASIKEFKVSRVSHVFPLPTLGYSRNVPSVRTSLPGVFVANSSQILNGTLNVNETMQLAARVFPILNGKMPDGLQALERRVEPLSSGAVNA